jgi:DNA modification methylase
MFDSKGLIVNADAADPLPFPDGYFHCIATSPPYWSLRKYKGEQERNWPEVSFAPMPGLPEITVSAWRGGLGLEPSPEMHVGHFILIARDLYRVLRPDGTLWLNYGDSFSGSGGENGNWGLLGISRIDKVGKAPGRSPLPGGNVMLIPFRIALAMQADGWILRNDDVWAKRTVMPEPVRGWRFEQMSCDCMSKRREAAIAANRKGGIGRNRLFGKGFRKPGDIGPDPKCPNCHGTGKFGCVEFSPGSWRHTRTHEYVFQFVKDMGYFSDQEIVREREGRNPRSVAWQDADPHLIAEVIDALGNPSDVFDLGSQPYKGAHYATFPASLVAVPVMASTPRYACPACGAPWAPVIERRGLPGGSWHDHGHDEQGMLGQVNSDGRPSGTVAREGWQALSRRGIGYLPTCKHYDASAFRLAMTPGFRTANKRKRGHQDARNDWLPRALGNRRVLEYIMAFWQSRPGIVFDPFFGSGTIGEVARSVGLDFVGMDISFPYLSQQARVRALKQTPPGALDDLPMFRKTQIDFDA